MRTAMIGVSIITAMLAAFACRTVEAATTITYTYDKQHRLTQVSYSASEKVFYSYDRANNLDLEVSITDSKYLKSFLLYFSWIDPVLFAPELLQTTWETVWSNLQKKS